ncbi:MAG: HAD-IB family phosphatase [Vulcanimicrobiaceae bacterium]
MRILVDFDGTITDRDGFDLLSRHHAGPQRWERLDRAFLAGTITLRDVLSAQARCITGTLDDARAYLDATTIVDPTFGAFVDRCVDAGHVVRIVSSGVRQLIDASLAEHGIYGVEVAANAAIVKADGWELVFRDDSHFGHDKRVHVLDAQAMGERVVYIGDGISDFAAAEFADLRYAKEGSLLDEHLRSKHLAFTPFESFNDVLSDLVPAVAPTAQRDVLR